MGTPKHHLKNKMLNWDWLLILSFLTSGEKYNGRLVSKEWCQTISYYLKYSINLKSRPLVLRPGHLLRLYRILGDVRVYQTRGAF
jgi:hypothetical protein